MEAKNRNKIENKLGSIMFTLPHVGIYLCNARSIISIN